MKILVYRSLNTFTNIFKLLISPKLRAKKTILPIHSWYQCLPFSITKGYPSTLFKLTFLFLHFKRQFFQQEEVRGRRLSLGRVGTKWRCVKPNKCFSNVTQSHSLDQYIDLERDPVNQLITEPRNIHVRKYVPVSSTIWTRSVFF